MTNVRRKQCGKPDCKRAFNAERMRKWQRQYQAEHGQWYTSHKHGEAQRAYHRQRREELGHWRQLYPAAAAAYDARRRMRVEQASQGEPVVPADVHARDGWTCQLCGLPIDPEVAWPDPMSASVDHIVPLALDGAHSMANVQSAHLGCNSRKSARLTITAAHQEPAPDLGG
jgi:5-methylcytosine-specific restriction endonuclease McrA